MDGHALILQLCHAKKDERVQKTVEKDKSSTKLVIRNVAFEATDKDLRQLFNPFGQVISYIKLLVVHFAVCKYKFAMLLQSMRSLEPLFL